MTQRKLTIVGSGISGLSAGKIFSKRFDVKILERKPRIGSIVSCDVVDGNLFHKVGGHVFNSRNADVLQSFWSFFDKDKEFLKAKRNAKILLNGNLVGYPIENHLHQLSA